MIKNSKFSLTLFSDYKYSTNQFAVCNENGTLLWSGVKEFKESQNRGELYAAKKALFICNEIKKALNIKDFYLNLKVDAQWLTHNKKTTNLAYTLVREAFCYGIKISVKWVPSKKNRADEGTIQTDIKEFDLKWVLENIENKQEQSKFIRVMDNKFYHLDLFFSYRVETNKFAIVVGGDLVYGGRCSDIGDISQERGEKYVFEKIKQLLVKVKQHSDYKFLYVDAKSDIEEIVNKTYRPAFINELKKIGVFVKLGFVRNYENEAKIHTCRSKEEMSKEIDVQEILKCVVEVDKRRVNEDFVEESATTPVYQDSLF